MDINRRQSRTNDNIRKHNEHQNRILKENIGRKHGLEDTRNHNTRSVDREMANVKRDFEKIRTKSVSRRRSSNDLACIVRCQVRKPDIGSKNGVSPVANSTRNGTGATNQQIDGITYNRTGSTYRDTSPAGIGKQEYNESRAVIESRGEEKNSLNVNVAINQVLSQSNRLASLSGYDFNEFSKYRPTNTVEFVEENEITYQVDQNRARKNNARRSWYSPPIAPSNLTLESPTFYNHAKLSTSKPPEEDFINKHSDLSGDTGEKRAHLSLSSSLLAMATANSNFMRSQSIDYGSEVGSLTNDAANEVSDAHQSATRRGSQRIIKVNDLLRPAKFDRDKYNPDGSVRTIHKLPDFQKSYDQARKARYIRSQEQLERDKELTTKEIFQKEVRQKDGKSKQQQNV